MESSSSHKRKWNQVISCKAPSSRGVVCPLNCYYVLFIDWRFWFCCVWISDNAQFLLSVCSTSNHKILFVLLGHFLSFLIFSRVPVLMEAFSAETRQSNTLLEFHTSSQQFIIWQHGIVWPLLSPQMVLLFATSHHPLQAVHLTWSASFLFLFFNSFWSF